MKRHIEDFSTFGLNEASQMALDVDDTTIGGFRIEDLGLTPEQLKRPYAFAVLTNQTETGKERPILLFLDGTAAILSLEDMVDNYTYPEWSKGGRYSSNRLGSVLMRACIRIMSFQDIIEQVGEEEFRELIKEGKLWI
jgi:hypothetical protein